MAEAISYDDVPQPRDFAGAFVGNAFRRDAFSASWRRASWLKPFPTEQYESFMAEAISYGAIRKLHG